MTKLDFLKKKKKKSIFFTMRLKKMLFSIIGYILLVYDIFYLVLSAQ